MVQFQVISWYSGDEGNKYMIHIFGRSDDGKVHHVKFPYKPCLYIRCNHFPVNLREKYAQRFEKVQNMRSVWGYSEQPQIFYKIRFDSLRQRKFAELDLKKTFKVFEANIDPVLRFMHESGVSSTGWVDVPDGLGVVRMHNIRPVPERADIAPIRIMSLDIECYSQSHSFPDPSKANDCVFQIAMTTRTWGSDAPPDECLLCISEYKTEKTLLEAFAKKMRQIDPDVITGWNIFGFDLEYLYKRLGMVNCSPMAYHWGRDLEHPVDLVEKRLASNALGSNMLKMVPIFGRYVFDLFQEVKREQKFESYSLNHVSKVLLGDSKLDMPIKEMFRKFEEGDLADVGAYCIKDTLLPHRIMDRLCTVPNLIEMAKATWVPLNYLTERGQQIKVFSQISKKAREMGFLIPTLYSKDESDEKYKGATVLEANIGAYYEPVTALDFASLYPSIMMAHNLCYSTILLDGATHPNEELVGEARYVQGVPALLPAVLRELKQFRKQAKKDMANAKGTPMEDVYNAKQLAYKISMNSVYGFTGATKGFLPLVDIASSVTAKGREMIQMTKDIIESEFPGSKVLYGDSVMPYTPVLIRDLIGTVKTTEISNLAGEGGWEEYPGFAKEGTNKERYDEPGGGIEAWTHLGWQRVVRVIRHKCKKSIWRVVTHTGVVDVTEDHSLLDENLNLLKPGQTTTSTKLYQYFPESIPVTDSVNDDALFVYGMFVGDGSCGVYNCPSSGKKHTWAINNQNMELLTKCKTILEAMYPELKFVIMDTMKSSHVYKLVPRGKVSRFVEAWREECYDGKCKKIPLFAFGNKSFMEGLWASDGCRKDNEKTGCHRIDTKNQITAQWYYMYLKSMGYNVSLNTRSDKHEIFRLTFTEGELRKTENQVKKIFKMHEEYDGYVYDLETEAGSFQAGVGSIVVKNTDSVMVQFDVGQLKGQDAIRESWRLGEIASARVQQSLRDPNELELEKVYCPYFLYSKKRYAAMKWVLEKGDQLESKVDVKGLQLVRRDTCPYVRSVCKSILDTILQSPDPIPVVRMVRQAREDLLQGRVPMEELVLTRSLAAEYKSQNLAHVKVRDKIRERMPGSEPKSGDRIAFVLVKTESPKDKAAYLKAEDPQWAREHGMQLDYEYYFKNHLRKPVSDLLEPIIDPKDLWSLEQH